MDSLESIINFLEGKNKEFYFKILTNLKELTN